MNDFIDETNIPRFHKNSNPITVQSIHKLPNGRLRIKIKEKHLKPDTIQLSGVLFKVHKNLGRGRIVVKKDG